MIGFSIVLLPFLNAFLSFSGHELIGLINGTIFSGFMFDFIESGDVVLLFSYSCESIDKGFVLIMILSEAHEGLKNS